MVLAPGCFESRCSSVGSSVPPGLVLFFSSESSPSAHASLVFALEMAMMCAFTLLDAIGCSRATLFCSGAA